ncbi:hypothetical protein L1887_02960 [Cichorium endivia]|nr:hypothetical protein L1887_02960 [Cichorium endivia]
MFDFRLFSAEMQDNEVYPTASPAFSDYTNFSDKAMEGRSVNMKDAIQRELEKEMIREKIMAEEVERFHVLEAEVRRELMMGRELMAMQSGRGVPSSFMVGPQPDEFKETATSHTGNPYASTLPDAKFKPPPSLLPAAGGSTEFKSCISKKMEWRCSICKISAPCERGLLEHLAGKKHHAKAASIVIKNTPKCVPSLNKKMEWKCLICEVSVPCELGLQDHLAGKKHKAKVEALRADNIEKAKMSGETHEPLGIKNSPECAPNNSEEDKKKQLPPSLPAVAGSVELPKKKMEWRCPICKVCLTSEIDLQTHLAGKKHKAKAAIIRKGKNI